MPIPIFESSGLLPPGVHDCTLDEIKVRFGSFHGSDRRPQLFVKLLAFLSEVRASQIVRRLVVNGSFVTAKPAPNDIDLIVVVNADHDFTADLTPVAYNAVSKQRVRRRYGFDLLVAREGSVEYHRWTEFFQQVRLEPGRVKGILTLML